MSAKVRMSSAGIAEVLASAEVAAEIQRLSSTVAGAVRGGGGATASGKRIEVKTRERTAKGGGLSARPAADVYLAHPAGMAVEAKRAPLAKGAGSVGLEVTSRRPT